MKSITIERLRELLSYDPETGALTWLKRTSNRIRVGDAAGTHNKTLGYLQVSVDGVRTYAHRLAWFYVHQEWPEEIDHINGIRSDNRLCNLRPATKKQNCENRVASQKNKSGYRGVNECKKTHLWVARIHHNGKGRSLGYFKTPALAGEFAELAREMVFTHHRMHL